MTESVSPYTDRRQRHAADMMGMYLFLGTEIMLFGGLFAAMALTRLQHPAEYVAHSRELHLWIGAWNTVILLTSSLFAALAVHAAREGAGRAAARWLGATAAFGLGFLALKATEYTLEFREGLLPVTGGDGALSEPVQRLFMHLYLVSTGLHAVHLTIGICVVTGLAWRLRRAESARAIPVEITGLYWHLIDVVWVFLYPVLYLAR
ncbi:cytochrome c oxidase subunit 3 [Amaricoccus solimangrovi]|uniref:Cytochrome c oxidase polypeptide III n=1 Tax=Amaricoccus solimangrovi TaxID=2589815 RepID=A0A501WNY8_9RHOB|nr:cytochrome c oxidase subunit 3 [Amaricoccus solimangrovi]TPE51048.1 cytochrome c oxidase polypeptide III [Amaricoccus solimangrovi]